MSPKLHRQLGLTDDEASSISELLGRSPNPLELAMYAVMWSEHCSYKSSRRHLSRLPTQAPWVLVGPGENAGVIDVGDGIAIAIRIESHNHPSAVEPYQGAATGVGGILRDIFTMGARPIAVMDALRFGSLDDAKNRWIMSGVVSGIAGYGNSVGVPTVGGEVVSCETYGGNPLVNVAALGVLRADRLVLGEASEVGAIAVLMGAATGRDGIGGVSVLASAGFGDADASKLPNVQVGDPFEEKRLIEACLEMLDAQLLIGLQDLGGAGLTCATSEAAARGGAGMEIDVAKVPLRQPEMEPFEVMTSESQERMLAIVSPARVDEVLAICEKWEISAAAIGRVTDDGILRIVDGDASTVLAEIPAASLANDAPNYDRPMSPPDDLTERRSQDVLTNTPDVPTNTPVNAKSPTHGAHSGHGGQLTQDLLALLADPAWVYRQYDHQLFCNTVVGPGGDGTLLILKHPDTGKPTGRGLGISTDGNHRWCYTDPRLGTAALVAEAVLNIACVGARPRALVNCLNFGNPTHPEVMWQLSESVDGMAQACEAFGLPVVGGNVSLYNETNGTDIAPTPVVCVLGVHPDLRQPPPGPGLVDGHDIVLLGPVPDAAVTLGGTRFAWDRLGRKDGALAEPNLPAIVRVGSLVADLVVAEAVSAVHDVSEGGLAVTLAEMACYGEVGCDAIAPLLVGTDSASVSPDAVSPDAVGPDAVSPDVVGPDVVGPDAVSPDPVGPDAVGPDAVGPDPVSPDPTAKRAAVRALFNESHGRVIVCVGSDERTALIKRAAAAGVTATTLGTAGGNRIGIRPEFLGTEESAGQAFALDISLVDVLAAWRDNLAAVFDS